MTKDELIKTLQNLDISGDTEVRIMYDGEPRARLDHAYVSRDNKIIVASGGESIYSKEHEPQNESLVNRFEWTDHPQLKSIGEVDLYEW